MLLFQAYVVLVFLLYLLNFSFDPCVCRDFTRYNFLSCFWTSDTILYIWWFSLVYLMSSQNLYILSSFVFSFTEFHQCYFNSCHFGRVNADFFRQRPSSGDICRYTFFPMFFDSSMQASLYFFCFSLCCKKYIFSLSLLLDNSPS